MNEPEKTEFVGSFMETDNLESDTEESTVVDAMFDRWLQQSDQHDDMQTEPDGDELTDIVIRGSAIVLTSQERGYDYESDQVQKKVKLEEDETIQRYQCGDDPTLFPNPRQTAWFQRLQTKFPPGCVR